MWRFGLVDDGHMMILERGNKPAMESQKWDEASLMSDGEFNEGSEFHDRRDRKELL